MRQWKVKGQWEVRGHVTHIVGGTPALDAIAHMASEAGAVPLTLTHILTASMPTAAAIVLHTNKHTAKYIFSCLYGQRLTVLQPCLFLMKS